MTETELVLLCGCGWLGQQLIQPLQQSGITVCGTSRSEDKVSALIEQGVLAAPFSLGNPFPDYLLLRSLRKSAVIMLPPGRRNKDTSSWELSLTQLFDTLVDHELEHIIFVSTTSVYGDSHDGVITEDSPVSPDTASGQAHVRMEQYLRQVAPTTSSVLRPAGLVGAVRHPIRTLSGRSLTAPNKAVNLVYGEDVVSAILALLAIGPVLSPLHLCSKSHPQRKTYYEWAAEQLGIAKPSFTPDDEHLPTTGKRIDASHTWSTLGVTPRFSSPYDMLVAEAGRD